MSSTLKIAMGSILVGLMVLGLKTLAWYLTGSVALLSDALESIVNVATALAALVANQTEWHVRKRFRYFPLVPNAHATSPP